VKKFSAEQLILVVALGALILAGILFRTFF